MAKAGLYHTDNVHPFMETVFPDGSGLLQQDNVPCHKVKMVQEGFEEDNSKFEVLPWLPNSPDLPDLLGARHHSTSCEVQWSPCLNWSGLQKDLHNIRQVVVMFCLIGVLKMKKINKIYLV